MLGRSIAMASIAILLAGACQSIVVPSPTSTIPGSTPADSTASPRATTPPSPVAGGCGATQVFAGPGPDASLGLQDNPWAPATPADAGIVAYFWHPPPAVIFATGPDGDPTKVLWISHIERSGRLSVTAHPLGATSPLVSLSFPAASSPTGNYPSGIDLPSAGCWHFDLALGTAHAAMDLEVAPARTSPSPPTPSSPSSATFTVTGAQAGEVALVVRFVTAFNAGRVDDALALFTQDANISDCDFTTRTAIQAQGRPAIRSWLTQRSADHDRLVLSKIFNMNPDSDQAVGVEFALRSSDTIARLGAPDGLVPEGIAKIGFDASGQRIGVFANGPVGADPGIALRVCSVPVGTSSPLPTPSG